jgi:hypothetical protein
MIKLHAMDRRLRIQERRAKLLGLDKHRRSTTPAPSLTDPEVEAMRSWTSSCRERRSSIRQTSSTWLTAATTSRSAARTALVRGRQGPAPAPRRRGKQRGRVAVRWPSPGCPGEVRRAGHSALECDDRCSRPTSAGSSPPRTLWPTGATENCCARATTHSARKPRLHRPRTRRRPVRKTASRLLGLPVRWRTDRGYMRTRRR